MAKVSESEFVQRVAKKTGKSAREVKEFFEAEAATLAAALRANEAVVKTPHAGIFRRRPGGKRRTTPQGISYVTKAKVTNRLQKRLKKLFGL